jgi:hypothetical protein
MLKLFLIFLSNGYALIFIIFGQISIFYKTKLGHLVNFSGASTAAAAGVGTAIKKIAIGMGVPPEPAAKFGSLAFGLGSANVISYKWKVAKLKQAYTFNRNHYSSLVDAATRIPESNKEFHVNNNKQLSALDTDCSQIIQKIATAEGAVTTNFKLGAKIATEYFS